MQQVGSLEESRPTKNYPATADPDIGNVNYQSNEMLWFDAEHSSKIKISKSVSDNKDETYSQIS